MNKPLIYSFHGIHTTCLNRSKKYLYILYENLTGWLDNEKVFVSLSEKLQAIHLKIFIGKNTRIINNSSKKMIRNELNSKNNNFKIELKMQRRI